MPSFPLLIAILSIISPVLVVIDCLKEKYSAETLNEDQISPDQLSGILVLASPFLALMYPDGFWSKLLVLALLSALIFALQWICYRMSWVKLPPENIYLLPGSCLVSIVIYFIFFHEGPIQSPGIEAIAINENQWTLAYLWPWCAYMTGILFAISSRNSGSISAASLAMILLFNLLPFFTGFYWTSMLAGICIFAMIIQRMTSHLEISVRGGFAFISAFAYLMTASTSVVIYALLY